MKIQIFKVTATALCLMSVLNCGVKGRPEPPLREEIEVVETPATPAPIFSDKSPIPPKKKNATK